MKTRKRGVFLTDEGLVELSDAIQKRWETEYSYASDQHIGINQKYMILEFSPDPKTVAKVFSHQRVDLSIIKMMFLLFKVVFDRIRHTSTEPVTNTSGKSFFLFPNLKLDFMARIAELESIAAALNLCGVAVITGMGGIGKTQAAIAFAHQYSKKYDWLFWVRSDSFENTSHDFGQLICLLEPNLYDNQESAIKTEAMRTWLSKNDNYLIVFDNMDHVDHTKTFLPSLTKGHVLITSRLNSLLSNPNARIRLKPFSDEEAMEYFDKSLGRSIDAGEECEAALTLARSVGFLPLGLSHIVAYKQENDVTFKSCLRSYEKMSKGLGKALQTLDETGLEQTSKSWLLNLEQVRKKYPVSASILMYCVFLSPERIPYELFENGAKAFGGEIASLSEKFKENDDAFHELLSPLVKFSLLDRDNEGRTFSIHRLILEAVEETLSAQEKIDRFNQVASALTMLFPEDEILLRAGYDRLYTHIARVFKWSEELDLNTEMVADLFCAMGETEFHLNFGNGFEILFHRAYDIFKSIHSAPHPNIGKITLRIGFSANIKSNFEDGAKFLTVSLENYQALGESYLQECAEVFDAFGMMRRMQGKVDEAAVFINRSINIYLKMSPVNLEKVAESTNNIGLIYLITGKYLEAEEQLLKSLSIRKSLFPRHHPVLAETMCNLAVIYYRTDRLVEAKWNALRTLSIRKRTFGVNHPLYTSTLGVVATWKRVAGDLEAAYKLLELAESLLRKMVNAKGFLANILTQQGDTYVVEHRFFEALETYNEAREIQQSYLPPDHIDNLKLEEKIRNCMESLQTVS